MISKNFIIDQQRNRHIENITEEYLNIIALLYGTQIESGIRRIKDYASMTMLDAENELRIRTIMNRAERLRTKRRLYAEHTAAEQELLERLKNASK